MANKHYSKKPAKDLWKKGGFSDKRSYDQHRKHPEQRPEHAKWKRRKWSNL